jgi:hypothetical protein
MDPDFDPEFFAHGRLFWRFENSDAVRFSPRLAWAMVGEAAELSAGAGCLWDPFAGSGLIPALARVFFPGAFSAIAGSDASTAAVEASAKNLALVSNVAAATQRLSYVAGLRGQNPKSDRRWGEVEGYLRRLLPRIERAAETAVATRVECALAQEQLATMTAEPDSPPLYIVGDAPYGRGSDLLGPPLSSVAQAWIDEPLVAYVNLVCTAEQAHQLPVGPGIRVDPARSGRARWQFQRAAPLVS